MGRVKLKIKKQDNMSARQATYYKRKNGIMKKAKELSILCDIDLVLLMFSPSGNPSLCTGEHSIGEVISKLARLPPQERATRKLESVKALKRTFMSLGHDVITSEFLDRSKPTLEVLSEKVRFLQTHLSETHARLSYWTKVEKIDNIDDLQKLENSVRQSLYQIRAHKENMLQHQEQQLMPTESKYQIQSDIDIMDMEQHLENFSWVHTDENMNVSIKEEDLNLESYSGLFGKSSVIRTPKLETSDIPGTSADQLSNLSFLNDPRLQQLAEWNLLGTPADYYVSQILEASNYKPQFGGNLASSETLTYPVNVFDDASVSLQPNLQVVPVKQEALIRECGRS